jgi:hypothetical protein
MRSIDLALFADTLAADAAALSARIERARGRLRQIAIEHEARRALAPDVVALLERRGLMRPDAAGRSDDDLAELATLSAELDAVLRLQSWVEARLAESEQSAGVRSSGPVVSVAPAGMTRRGGRGSVRKR